MKSQPYTDRRQGLGEEIANSISHGVGFLGAIAVTPILIVNAAPLGPAAIVGVSVFGVTMMLLYISSTLYHAFPHKRVDPNNRWRHMRNVDFCELLQLAESDPAILFWDAQWQNQKDPFFMEPCDEGHDDTNAQGLIDRAPTLCPIIPLKPQNDETP